MTRLIHQNVAGLQVPVDDPALMGVMHRFADAGRQLQPLLRIEAPLCRVNVERIAANELHAK
jgi:hypothetical protein